MPQLPGVITVNKSDLRFDLPMEVCGWLLQKFKVHSGDWILVGTPDLRGRLGSNMVIRAPMAVNLVVGMTELQSTKVLLLTKVLLHVII